MPMRSFRVVFLEAEIERRQRRHGPGDADRAAGLERREERAHVCARGCELGPRRRIRREEALGDAHAADVEARRRGDLAVCRHHELGRASADVDDEHVVEWGAPRRDAADHHRRLFRSGEQPRREAVAPFDLAEERLAVLRVAHCARRDRERAFGPVLLERPAVLA